VRESEVGLAPKSAHAQAWSAWAAPPTPPTFLWRLVRDGEVGLPPLHGIAQVAQRVGLRPALLLGLLRFFKLLGGEPGEWWSSCVAKHLLIHAPAPGLLLTCPQPLFDPPKASLVLLCSLPWGVPLSRGVDCEAASACAAWTQAHTQRAHKLHATCMDAHTRAHAHAHTRTYTHSTPATHRLLLLLRPRVLRARARLRGGRPALLPGPAAAELRLLRSGRGLWRRALLLLRVHARLLGEGGGGRRLHLQWLFPGSDGAAGACCIVLVLRVPCPPAGRGSCMRGVSGAQRCAAAAASGAAPSWSCAFMSAFWARGRKGGGCACGGRFQGPIALLLRNTSMTQSSRGFCAAAGALFGPMESLPHTASTHTDPHPLPPHTRTVSRTSSCCSPASASGCCCCCGGGAPWAAAPVLRGCCVAAADFTPCGPACVRGLEQLW